MGIALLPGTGNFSSARNEAIWKYCTRAQYAKLSATFALRPHPRAIFCTSISGTLTGIYGEPFPVSIFQRKI